MLLYIDFHELVKQCQLNIENKVYIIANAISRSCNGVATSSVPYEIIYSTEL